MAYEYIMDDLAGYPFNAKYPPNRELYGGLYHGYRNNTEETFFYDFAVQKYNLRFRYKGIDYYFLSEPDYAAQCDSTFCREIRCFKDGNAVLEEFEINGIKLIDLIPLIEDCEIY